MCATAFFILNGSLLLLDMLLLHFAQYLKEQENAQEEEQHCSASSTDQERNVHWQEMPLQIIHPHPLTNTHAHTRAHTHTPVLSATVGNHEAVDGGRALVGAVRAPKLLDGAVCRPRQLQGDVEAAALVGYSAHVW
eukprot:1138300-Pelagomonas_calceolata.AAC.13